MSAFAAASPAYVRRLAALAGRLAWADLEARAGLSRQAIEAAAAAYAGAERAVILFGRDVVQSGGAVDTRSRPSRGS